VLEIRAGFSSAIVGLNPFFKIWGEKHGNVIHMILPVQFLLEITGKIESLQKTFLRDIKLDVC
jgi:hypothetical protein